MNPEQFDRLRVDDLTSAVHKSHTESILEKRRLDNLII